jgi:inorganic phosphate transporter, PiT family
MKVSTDNGAIFGPLLTLATNGRRRSTRRGRIVTRILPLILLTHGANDGQKTMGVITALLIAGGFLDSESFVVPIWVILGAAMAIAIGTFLGGWRIVKTMAFRLTQLRPYQGFCAETGGGAILTSMAWLGIPVSTTHAISGAIMGVGATKRLSAVRWGVGKRLIYAWIITIPASAGIAAVVLIILNSIIGRG